MSLIGYQELRRFIVRPVFSLFLAFFLHWPKKMIAVRVVILKGHLHEIFNSGILTFLHFFHYHVLDLDSWSLIQEPVMELFLGLVRYIPSWNDLVLEERVQVYLLRAGELNDKSCFIHLKSLMFLDWNLLVTIKTLQLEVFNIYVKWGIWLQFCRFYVVCR